MNGKRAKAIARRTEELMQALGIRLGEGYGKYQQVDNCKSWELAKDPDGKHMKDPDGTYLRQLMNTPGTINSKYKYRLFYRWLKRMYKKRDKDGMAIINASPEQLYRLAKVMMENK